MILQIGVKVIIKNSNNEVLLLRRSPQHLLPNKAEEAWDIPGGRIEVHESLQEALVREVKEEIGVQLVGSPILLEAQDIFVSHKDLHVVRLTYLHSMDIDAITLSDEHADHQWISLEETQNLTIEPFLKSVLDSLISKI